jgi:hypothetical protein
LVSTFHITTSVSTYSRANFATQENGIHKNIV